MGNKNSRLEPHQQQQVDKLWSSQRQDMESGGGGGGSHHFAIPLNRVRDIMKKTAGDNKISAELPALMEKACELFIADLALRARLRALNSDNRRPLIQENDIHASLNSAYNMAFVHDLVYFNKLMSSRPH